MIHCFIVLFCSPPRTIDNQIVDIVTKVVAGQGIPWLRSAALKRLAGYEKTRVVILRHLEERVGVRTGSEVVMATSPQISHVVSWFCATGWFTS